MRFVANQQVQPNVLHQGAASIRPQYWGLKIDGQWIGVKREKQERGRGN